MKVVVTIARVLLGLVFVILGLNGFLHFIPGAPPPGPAARFTVAMYATNYYVLPVGVQVLAGALLLLNRYVPLALVLLGAVLANIIVFHLTMLPEGLPLALVVTALWFVVAWPLRRHFAPIFVRHVRR